MNYNEEMAEVYKEVGLEAGVRQLTPEEKATSADWEALKRKIQEDYRECDRMLDRSMLIANAMIAMEKQEKKSNS